MKSQTRLMRRGYKFTGENANRKRNIYHAYRYGADSGGLALAWGLTMDSFWKIIAEGNGGSLAAACLDDICALESI